MYPDYDAYGEGVTKPGTHAQIGINGWAADFAAPSTMASPFVCVPNDSEFCAIAGSGLRST